MKKLLFVLCIIGILFSGLSVTDVTISQDSFKPGEQGSISFTAESSSTVQTTTSAGTVTSSAGEKISSVSVTFYPGNYVTMADTYELGDLDAGTSVDVSIPLKIKDNAISGIYTIIIRARGISDGNSIEKSSIASIKIINEPILSIESKEDMIEEGKESHLIIKNNGGAVSKLRIKTTGDVAIKGKDEIFVGEVKTEIEVPIEFEVSNANDGSNDVEITLTYYNELGAEEEESKTIRLNIKKQESDIFFIQKSEIMSNKESLLELKVKNTGKSIENLKISFPDGSIKMKEKERIDVGDLASNGEADVSFVVFASLNPGVNSVEALLEWEENGEKKSDTIKIPLTVTSDSEIGVYLEAKPSPLRAGEQHALTLRISNLGSYTINNVEVEVKSNAFEILDIQSVKYVGEIKNDDYGNIKFDVNAPEKAGTGNMTISIKYKDQSGEWKTTAVTEELNVYPKESKGNGSLLYIIIALVIIGGVYWKFFRKRGNQ